MLGIADVDALHSNICRQRVHRQTHPGREHRTLGDRSKAMQLTPAAPRRDAVLPARVAFLSTCTCTTWVKK